MSAPWDRVHARIDAIEASLKLDRKIWDEYERQLSERPTMFAVRQEIYRAFLSALAKGGERECEVGDEYLNTPLQAAMNGGAHCAKYRADNDLEPDARQQESAARAGQIQGHGAGQEGATPCAQEPPTAPRSVTARAREDQGCQTEHRASSVEPPRRDAAATDAERTTPATVQKIRPTLASGSTDQSTIRNPAAPSRFEEAVVALYDCGMAHGWSSTHLHESAKQAVAAAREEIADLRSVVTPPLSAGQREALGLPVAKAPDEPPAAECARCHGRGWEPFAESVKPQGFVASRRTCRVCHGTGTQAKEQPSCQKQNQSQSVASAAVPPTAPPTGTTQPSPTSSADDAEAYAELHNAKLAAQTWFRRWQSAVADKRSTEPAPSSAAELRDAIRRADVPFPQNASHATREYMTWAVLMDLRAVEEIAELEACLTLQREEIGRNHADLDRAEAERDEAVRLLRGYYDGHTASEDVAAFLARHPDAAQGGGGKG